MKWILIIICTLPIFSFAESKKCEKGFQESKSNIEKENVNPNDKQEMAQNQETKEVIPSDKQEMAQNQETKEVIPSDKQEMAQNQETKEEEEESDTELLITGAVVVGSLFLLF